MSMTVKQNNGLTFMFLGSVSLITLQKIVLGTLYLFFSFYTYIYQLLKSVTTVN